MKIAVCISGLMQYWDITHKLFKYWNEIYDDVDFVFFLSTFISVINLPAETLKDSTSTNVPSSRTWVTLIPSE